MKLTIVDNTGRISSDPRLWPAELKQAVEQCCCEQSSGSSSSGSSGGRLTSCCPNTPLPDILYATISGGTAIDGSYALVWDGTLQAWATSKIFQFTCFIGLSFHTFSFRLAFDLFCQFIWEQFDVVLGTETISGRMRSTTNCGNSLTCSPFYFASGLVSTDGFPPRKVCDGSVNEVSNTCNPLSGPFVEITL